LADLENVKEVINRDVSKLIKDFNYGIATSSDIITMMTKLEELKDFISDKIYELASIIPPEEKIVPKPITPSVPNIPKVKIVTENVTIESKETKLPKTEEVEITTKETEHA